MDIDKDLRGFTIDHPNLVLSEGEQVALAKTFNEPLVKKYLQVLIFNTLKDCAEIPLDVLAQDGPIINAVKQAYVKGSLSILYTLNTIEVPKPISVQATQQGQSQQR